MSAVFEIILLLKKQKTICSIFDLMKREFFDCKINFIQVVDDWEYSNQKKCLLNKSEFVIIQLNKEK
jgi:hypothetical protein